MLKRSSNIPIRVADCEQTRRAIYKFRYKIYIEEMGKPYRNADHENRLLTDELDENATLLYAEESGEIVGTTRINWGSDPIAMCAFREPFDLDMFQEFPSHLLSFCSR